MEANPSNHGWPRDGFFGGGYPKYSDFIRDIATGALKRDSAPNEADEVEPDEDEPRTE